MAPPMPRTPPTIASATDSASRSPATNDRLAPSARRMETSLLRSWVTMAASSPSSGTVTSVTAMAEP